MKPKHLQNPVNERGLESFQVYLEARKDLTDRTKTDAVLWAKAFLHSIEKKGLNILSIEKGEMDAFIRGKTSRLAMVKKFFYFLEKLNLIRYNRGGNRNLENGQAKDLDRMLETYLEYQTLQGGSKRTKEILKSSLGQFQRYLAENNITDIRRVDRLVMDDYTLELLVVVSQKTGKPLSVHTRATRIAQLKDFFLYLLKEGVILKDPAAGLKIPKTPKRIPKDIPTVEEIDKLLRVVESSGPGRYKDYSMIELMYSTGIRVAEIVKLKPRDVNYDRKLITIREGKGGKDRTVPVSDSALDALREYLEKERPGIENKEGEEKPVFIGKQGEALETRYIRLKIQDYGRKAKLTKHLVPHSFRYACATHMLSNGADIRYIQEMLGHERLSTTQLYTKVVRGDLKRMIRKFHPRESFDSAQEPKGRQSKEQGHD